MKLADIDQKKMELEKLELQVLEGLRSGEGQEVTREMWEELRQELRDRGKRSSQPIRG